MRPRRGLRPTLLFSLAFLAYSTPVEAQSQWTYVEQSDGFTDEDRSVVVTLELGAGDASLGVGCAAEGLRVVYGPDGYMGGDRDDRVLVRYRVDRHPATQ